MDILQELVYLVGRNKVKGLDMKDLYLDQGSKLSILYQAIADGKVSSDEDALQHLYPEADDTKSYRYVKSQLRKRLLNYLFFIDLNLPAFTDRQKAFLDCHKKWATVNILFGRGARTTGVDVAESLIRDAMHYEFNEIVVDVAKLLRFHYGGLVGDKRKYKEYRKIYEQYEQFYFQENKIEGYYIDVIFSSFSQKTSKQALQQNITEAYQKIAPLLASTPTYKAQLNGYLTKVMMYASSYENERMIKACRQAIELFEAKPYQANTPLQIFYYQQLIGYTQLRKFAEGKQVAEKCLSFLEEGTFNWFKYYESYFVLAMHTEQYEEAYEIFVSATEHTRFRVMPKELTEIWKIYEAYLYLLLNREGVLDLDLEDSSVSKFRIGRFLNEIPTYSKEKRGMNIAILIIQILLYIQNEQYGKAIDRMEAIEKYCTRYLRSEETLRSFYFIKMLLIIPAQSFHKEAVLRHTKKYREKLEKLPIEIVDQDHKIEVVPYEKLWELSLGMLKKTFTRVRK